MEKKDTTFEPREITAFEQIAALNGKTLEAILEYPDNPAIQRVRIKAETDSAGNIYKSGYSWERPFVYRIMVEKDARIPSKITSSIEAKCFRTAEEAKEWCDKALEEVGKRFTAIIDIDLDSVE